jgi:alkylated DNA repair dioxygenase AlkB
MTQAMQAELFTESQELPSGFRYQPAFISEREEAELLATIGTLPLDAAKYKQYTARRRTVGYGSQYDFGKNRMMPAPSIPRYLHPLREQVARWLEIPPESFVHALVSEYPPGAPLGWHRDVPHFDVVVGVSLGGEAVMRLRPYRPGEAHSRRDVVTLTLAPRSAYMFRAQARWNWQHSIAATKELRYSVTLRTARATLG